MKLTPHFTLSEFACHDATRTPVPRDLVPRIRDLCVQLEILRAELGGRAITIVSGYRTPAWNRHVRGARNSQHVQGRAADIRVAGLSPARVHEVALRLYREGRLQIGGLGIYRAWVHVDVRPGTRLARWTGSGRTQG